MNNTRKRIAFCITDLDAGGAERALVQVVSRLHANDWQCAVFNLSCRGELTDVLEAHNVEVTNLDAGRRDLGVVFRLRKALKAFQPDLVQTFLFHANMAGRFAALGLRVPVVSGIRVSEKRSRWPLRLERWTERLVAAHVCVSQAVANFSHAVGGLSPEKLKVIRNGVDFEAYANAVPWDRRLPNGSAIPPDAPIILFVGRLDPQKAPEVLLNSLPAVFAQHPGMHLVLVGDGPLRDELQQSARQLNPSNIHFLGRQSDVPGFMKAANVLALPSRWEGLPNVVLESMAAGLPVVATAVDGTPELITDGSTGRLIPVDSASELSHALNDFLADADLRTSTARTAQAVVKKDFTWGAIAHEYSLLYKSRLGIPV